MKKFAVWISFICMFFMCAFGLGACKNKGPISDGDYAMQGAFTFVWIEGDICDTYGWEIEGNEARRWVSGSLDYKAKIIEQDGKIYFDGYKFKTIWDILFFRGSTGSNHNYEVVYDEVGKTITLTPMELTANLKNGIQD